MGSNNGTGRPMYFCCSRCRRLRGTYGGIRTCPHSGLGYCGGSNRVKLTGKKRECTFKNGSGRNSTHAREYVCGCCGHRGWSRHRDLEVKARAEAL